MSNITSNSMLLNREKQRESLKKRLDNFCTFQWEGIDFYEKYGAFIETENRGGLQFYSNRNFSNVYAKSQFETSASQLLGINFDTQQIQFKIFIFAITEDEFREMLFQLRPERIGYLSFSFNKYQYLVKLASLEDSPRYYIGRESEENLYSTELSLVFDVQGENVALENQSLKVNEIKDENENKITFNFNQGTIASDLPADFVLQFPLSFTKSNVEEEATASFGIIIQNKYHSLFTINIKPWKTNDIKYTYFPSEGEPIGKVNATRMNKIDNRFNEDSLNIAGTACYPLNALGEKDSILLEYHSKTGLVFLVNGEQKTLVTTSLKNPRGELMVTGFWTTPSYLPSKWEDSIENYDAYSFELKVKNCEISDSPSFLAYRKTNII